MAREVLDEQLDYYRARAPEYDRWFDRVGRFDRGAEATARWRAEVAMVREWLGALGLAGCDVLELASGTGIWTEWLLGLGARVTAVDAAPEMHTQLRQRCGERDDLTTVHGDLFNWSPPRTFDAVVSCFFMSHVPDESFDAFVGLVAAAARHGGGVFLLDSLRAETSTAADHTLPVSDAPTMVRRLDDGRTFTIVKRFRSVDELVDAAGRQGLAVEVRATPTYFQVVVGTRR